MIRAWARSKMTRRIRVMIEADVRDEVTLVTIRTRIYGRPLERAAVIASHLQQKIRNFLEEGVANNLPPENRETESERDERVN